MIQFHRNSGAAPVKILIHRRYLRLISGLKVTVLEPMSKPCLQTRCGKQSRLKKLSEVMKSFELSETVPQHLQLVQVVQFYQKLQSLLAGPEKWNREKKQISISVLCRNFTGYCCFQLKCSFPFHCSQVTATGSPGDTELSPGSTNVVPRFSREKLCSRTSCGFAVEKI